VNWNLKENALHKKYLISLYDKLKHLVIDDIKPIVKNWKKMKIFEPVKSKNLFKKGFDL